MLVLEACSVRISTGTQVILIKVFCSFPQFLQANVGIVPILCFLPNPSPGANSLHTDSIIKQSARKLQLILN
jgi:hypothetical protein